MIQTNSLWARLITSANRLSWIDASKLQSVLNVSAHRGGSGFRVADFKGIENRMNLKEGVVNPEWMSSTSTANPAYFIYQVDENAGDQLISGSLVDRQVKLKIKLKVVIQSTGRYPLTKRRKGLSKPDQFGIAHHGGSTACEIRLQNKTGFKYLGNLSVGKTAHEGAALW